MDRLRALLESVAPMVRLSGSWARGDARDDSDLDLFVSERNWPKVKEAILASGIPWDSCIVGHIVMRVDDEQVEFAKWFPRYRPAGREVEVLGVTFRT